MLHTRLHDYKLTTINYYNAKYNADYYLRVYDYYTLTTTR
jgi:hypothetical protein